MPKLLPIGIQDFEKMIMGNFIYVDKTRHMYEMARPLQGFYFLARPRRFGKSLMVSTFEYLFKGRRELFKNLWIDKSDWEWKPHPVVKVDFSKIDYDTPESLKKSLLLHVHETAKEHGIKIRTDSLLYSFASLITDLAKKYGESVAVLIDEYDKPMIEHLGKGAKGLETAKKNRDILKPFFGVLKAGDVSSALRFIFITGISKFARVSIFSDLNNLDDISMQDEFGHVMGYTNDELASFFGDHIDLLASSENKTREETIQRIAHWYNGYRFTELETGVYNPFSVIKLFKKRKYDNYWFETATPSFLVNLIKEKKYPVVDVEALKLPKELLSVYDLDRLSLEPLLFQTGYITIRHYDSILYHMGYPNQEVKVSFLSFLFNDLTRIEDIRLSGVYKLLPLYLRENRQDEFMETVQSILASIPYSQIAGKDEAWFHTVFYLMLAASGVDVRSEVLTSKGRIDLVLESDNRIFIVELKCGQNSQKAIEQILTKKYCEKYLKRKREIILIGINFNAEKRTIDDWQWGTLESFTK